MKSFDSFSGVSGDSDVEYVSFWSLLPYQALALSQYIYIPRYITIIRLYDVRKSSIMLMFWYVEAQKRNWHNPSKLT